MTKINRNTIATTCLASPLSWSAIFSGLFVTAASGALFSLLGTAIGLSLFQPNADAMSALSIAAIVWFILGGIISLFIGGMITGFAAPTHERGKSVTYGLVMWSFSFLLGIMLTMNGAGAILTGSGQLVGNAITISGKAASSALSPMVTQVADTLNLTENKSITKIAKQAQDLVAQASKKAAKANKENGQDVLESAGEGSDELVSSIKDFLTNTKDDMTQELHDAALKQLTDNTNLNTQQADQLLSKWQNTYQEVVDKAKEKADEMKEQGKEVATNVAGSLSTLTFFAFVAMVLGALAAMLGSLVGLKYHKE